MVLVIPTHIETCLSSSECLDECLDECLEEWLDECLEVASAVSSFLLRVGVSPAISISLLSSWLVAVSVMIVVWMAEEMLGAKCGGIYVPRSDTSKSCVRYYFVIEHGIMRCVRRYWIIGFDISRCYIRKNCVMGRVIGTVKLKDIEKLDAP